MCVAVRRRGDLLLPGDDGRDRLGGEGAAGEGRGVGSAARRRSPATRGSRRGNAAAGKAVFDANGCASCHTFKPAGCDRNDRARTSTASPPTRRRRTAARSTSTRHESIVDPNAYVVPGFPPGIMPQDFGQKLSKKQVADLVAFLTQPG